MMIIFACIHAPIWSHFESNGHCSVRQTDTDRLVPTYNTLCIDTKRHSRGANMLNYIRVVHAESDIAQVRTYIEMNGPRSIATQARYELASPRDVLSLNMADGNEFRATPEEAKTFIIPIVWTMGNKLRGPYTHVKTLLKVTPKGVNDNHVRRTEMSLLVISFILSFF